MTKYDEILLSAGNALAAAIDHEDADMAFQDLSEAWSLIANILGPKYGHEWLVENLTCPENL